MHRHLGRQEPPAPPEREPERELPLPERELPLPGRARHSTPKLAVAPKI